MNRKKLKRQIEDKLQNNEIDLIEDLIEMYEKQCPWDLDLYIFKGILNFYKGNLPNAQDYIKKGLKINELNFDLNYNMAIMSEVLGDELTAFRYYIRSKKLCNDDAIQDSIDKSIAKIIDVINEAITKSTNKKELEKNKLELQEMLQVSKEEEEKFSCYTTFPDRLIDKTYIGKYIDDTIREKYFVALYDYYLVQRDGNTIDNYFFNKVELFKAETIKQKQIECHEKALVPICSLDKDTFIEVKHKNEGYTIENMIPNRFYYYKMQGKNELRANREFILGNPIVLNKDPAKKSLVLNIFVDGLSQDLLKKEGLEKLMPNTYRYFSKGAICNNAFAAGEWTYVSLASFFTGRYTTNHGLFHPGYRQQLPQDQKILTEFFKEAGYTTAKIDGDWRTLPTYGYVRGMDRVVYQPQVRGMNLEEVIMESVEHIETFKEKNQFLWICLGDLHDVADEFEPRLLSQSRLDLTYRKYKEKSDATSVRKGYDENKIEIYEQQIRRIDMYLQMLYNYLNDNFTEEEIVVSLVSDHGQSYLIEEGKPFLSSERTNIALMIKSVNVPQGVCNELISGVDYLPIMCKATGIFMDESQLDCNLPVYFGGDKEREYVYTESIFPNDVYKVAINRTDTVLNFQSEENVMFDGRVALDKFHVNLQCKETGRNINDETRIQDDIEVIREHMKRYTIY